MSGGRFQGNMNQGRNQQYNNSQNYGGADQMDEDMYGGGGNYRNQGRGGNPNNQQQHYYNQPTGMENRRGGAQGGGYPKGPGMQPNPQQGAGAQYGHGQYTQGMPQQYQQTGPMRGNLRGQPQVPRGGNNPNTGGGHYGYYNQDPGNQMSDGGMGYQPPAQNQRGGYSGNPIGNQRPGIQQGVTPSQPAQNQRMYNNPANQQQMGGPQGHQNMPLAGHHHQQGAMGQIHPGQSRNMNANMQAAQGYDYPPPQQPVQARGGRGGGDPNYGGDMGSNMYPPQMTSAPVRGGPQGAGQAGTVHGGGRPTPNPGPVPGPGPRGAPQPQQPQVPPQVPPQQPFIAPQPSTTQSQTAPSESNMTVQNEIIMKRFNTLDRGTYFIDQANKSINFIIDGENDLLGWHDDYLINGYLLYGVIIKVTTLTSRIYLFIEKDHEIYQNYLKGEGDIISWKGLPQPSELQIVTVSNVEKVEVYDNSEDGYEGFVCYTVNEDSQLTFSTDENAISDWISLQRTFLLFEPTSIKKIFLDVLHNYLHQPESTKFQGKSVAAIINPKLPGEAVVYSTTQKAVQNLEGEYFVGVIALQYGRYTLLSQSKENMENFAVLVEKILDIAEELGGFVMITNLKRQYDASQQQKTILLLPPDPTLKIVRYQGEINFDKSKDKLSKIVTM